MHKKMRKKQEIPLPVILTENTNTMATAVHGLACSLKSMNCMICLIRSMMITGLSSS